MTYGRARTVESFLLEAARKRQFQVVVVEAAPGYTGRDMAMRLAQAGIDTTLIPDAAIAAMMGRVNKVIVGTHAVMADGGLLATAGTRMLAQSAKNASVPLLVCCGLYKLSPRFASDTDLLQDMHSPAEILPFEGCTPPNPLLPPPLMLPRVADFQGAELHVENPTWDVVPPELISLFITNTCDLPPAPPLMSLVAATPPPTSTASWQSTTAPRTTTCLPPPEEGKDTDIHGCGRT